MQAQGVAAWQKWIGSSRWRTLIAYEGWALDRNGVAPPDTTERVYSAPDIGVIPGECSQHLWIGRVMPGCALAFLAGRPFIIGAPADVNARLGSLFGGSGRARNLNLVLLSWDEAHIRGLADLYSQTDGLRPKTIWTSEWVYDRLRDDPSKPLREALASARVIRYDDSGNPQLEDSNSAAGDITVVLFDQRLDVSYLPQVSLSLAYDVAVSPTLRLQLRLYDTALNIHERERDAISSLDDYSSRILNSIWEEYPQARTALAESVERRLRELTERSVPTTAKVFTYIVDSEGRPGHPDQLTPSQLRSTSSPIAGADCSSAVKCAERNRQEVAGPLGMDDPFTTAKVETIEASAPSIDLRQSVVLAIGCGGLSTRSHGQITPTRRVLVRENLDVSLLGLKFLDYLNSFPRESEEASGKPALFSSKLVVFVSPWTISAVQEEISRLSWEFHDSLPPGFKVVCAEQQSIIPRHAQNGKEFYRQPDDGGFQYNTSGHYDIALWLAAHSGELDDARFVYYTNYNNLGRNIDANVGRLAALLDDRDAVALFELTPHFVGDSPVDEGSYWVSTDHDTSKGTGRLVKPVYCGTQGPSEDWRSARDRLFRDQRTPPDLHMSTGSLLFNVPRLLECPQPDQRALDKVPSYARHRSPLTCLTPDCFSRQQSSSAEVAIQFERDLDQLTWIRHCIGARVEADRSRFFPIKREEDLAQEKFDQLRELYKDMGDSRTGRPTELPPMDHPIALIPVEQHDPWGGYLIHAEKGLPFGEEPVSETWEASLHDRGVSGVVYSAIHHLPLVRFSSGGDDRDLDVMVKLLDCHDWLSLQVHPGEGMLRDLLACDEDSRRAICAERIMDRRGKEEMFIVLRQPEPEAGFYLGLEAAEVRGCSGIESLPSQPSSIEPSRIMEKSPLRSLSGLLETGPEERLSADISDLHTLYANLFEKTVNSSLPSILSIRGDARITVPVLDGIVLFLAFDALRKSLRDPSMSSASGVQSFIRQAYKEPGPRRADKELGRRLLKYFHRVDVEELKTGQVITVPPGFVHAAGPGLHLIELSHRSDNTFRIFDHGREVSGNPRLTHCALAATVLSAECLLDERTVQRYVSPPGSRPADRSLRFRILEGNDLLPKSMQERDVGDRSDTKSNQKRDTSDRLDTKSGKVVLCTRGRVRLKTRYGADLDSADTAAADADLTLWASHAAYVPPAQPGDRGRLDIATVGHHESSCVVVESRSVQGSPALCISIGGTQVEMAYEDDINGRRHEECLWHQILDEPWKRDWEARREALERKIKEFVNRCRKQPEDVPASQQARNSPVRVGIIWSGMIEGSGSPWHLRSRVVGDCEPFDPGRFLSDIGILHDPEWLHCLFDAKADSMAEVADVLGRLRDEHGRPIDGMVLNIASGLCIGIHSAQELSQKARYPERLKSGNQNVDLAHFGRIMWCDTSTGSWHLVKDTPDANAEKNDRGFIRDVRKRAAGQADVDSWRLMRASDLLSTTAIVMRYLGRRHQTFGPEVFFAENDEAAIFGVSPCSGCQDLLRSLVNDLGKMRCPARRIAAYTRALAEYRPVLNAVAESVIRYVNKQAYGPDSPEGRFAYEFVCTIAYDLADMLVALARQCPEVTPYLSRTVLSGYGGANFGVGPQSDKRKPFLKLLSEHVLCQLRCREVDCLQVQRTETFSNPYRLLDIFHDIWAEVKD